MAFVHFNLPKLSILWWAKKVRLQYCSSSVCIGREESFALFKCISCWIEIHFDASSPLHVCTYVSIYIQYVGECPLICRDKGEEQSEFRRTKAKAKCCCVFSSSFGRKNESPFLSHCLDLMASSCCYTSGFNNITQPPPSSSVCRNGIIAANFRGSLSLFASFFLPPFSFFLWR